MYEYMGPIPVVVRSKAQTCGRSIAGIAGLYPAGGIHVCVVCFTGKTKEKFRTRQRYKYEKSKKDNKRRNLEKKKKFLGCMYVCLLCCVGIGLCNGPITHPEESYRLYVCYTARDEVQQ
jgi:hypothetical protein